MKVKDEVTIDYARRLTRNGQYIHSAPWSVPAHGHRGVSQGSEIDLRISVGAGVSGGTWTSVHPSRHKSGIGPPALVEQDWRRDDISVRGSWKRMEIR
jgi:hypothetical protein